MRDLLLFVALLLMIIGIPAFVTGFIAELISRNSPTAMYTWLKKKGMHHRKFRGL